MFVVLLISILLSDKSEIFSFKVLRNLLAFDAEAFDSISFIIEFAVSFASNKISFASCFAL